MVANEAKEQGAKRQRKEKGSSQMDRSSPSLVVARRSSPRFAGKLKDVAVETPKSQALPLRQETDNESLSFRRETLASPTRPTLIQSALRFVLRGDRIGSPTRETVFQPKPMEISGPEASKERDVAREESLQNHGRTLSLNLTEMVAMFPGGEESSDDEEVESPDPSLALVGAYKVKKESAALLESIFLKHGDIAAECAVSIVEWRSHFLEACCMVFRSLEESAFEQLSVEDIEQKVEIVRNLEMINIQVGWLKQRLTDILEARQLVRQSSSLKEERDRAAEFIVVAAKKLEGYKLEAAGLEEKLLGVRENIDRTTRELAEAYNKTERVAKTHSLAKAKVRRFFKRSLVDGLL